MTQLQLPPIEPGMKVFRPIHYLGSKLRLVSALRTAIQAVAPIGPLCDLFAGSGTVSISMADTRPIISVDIQEYSRVLCSALLLRPNDTGSLDSLPYRAKHSALFSSLNKALEPIVEYEELCYTRSLSGNNEPLCDFMEHGSIAWFLQTGATGANRSLRLALDESIQRLKKQNLFDSVQSLVSRHFGGVYFSFRQGVALDVLLDEAYNLPNQLRDTALAPILSTASEVVNTIGKHFAQPIRLRNRSGKPKNQLVHRVVRDRQVDVFSIHTMFTDRYDALPETKGPHASIRQDFERFLAGYSEDVAVFYADPPYTRDHYSRFYHVLETMCLRDDPQISRTMIHSNERNGRISRGFYRIDRHQSPFCIKSKAPSAFTELFDGVKRFNVPLVLSYSPFDKTGNARPRVMTINQIVRLAQTRFRKVEVTSAGRFAHSKLNTQERNAPVNWDAEAIIICKP